MQAVVSTIYCFFSQPEAIERSGPRQRTRCLPIVSCDMAVPLPNTSDVCNSKSKRRPGNKPPNLRSLTSFCPSSPPALPGFASEHLEKSSPQSKQSNSCPPDTAISISISLSSSLVSSVSFCSTAAAVSAQN